MSKEAPREGPLPSKESEQFRKQGPNEEPELHPPQSALAHTRPQQGPDLCERVRRDIITYGDQAVAQLNLSARAYNALRRNEIRTLGQLSLYSTPHRLRRLTGIGPVLADDILAALNKNK